MKKEPPITTEEISLMVTHEISKENLDKYVKDFQIPDPQIVFQTECIEPEPQLEFRTEIIDELVLRRIPENPRLSNTIEFIRSLKSRYGVYPKQNKGSKKHTQW